MYLKINTYSMSRKQASVPYSSKQARKRQKIVYRYVSLERLRPELMYDKANVPPLTFIELRFIHTCENECHKLFAEG
jgi:hypothetical protein